MNKLCLEEVPEDICLRCASKCDLREIMMQLHRIESRITLLEHAQRMALSSINSLGVMQKRNFDKMMDGFWAIRKGFDMACGAAVDVSEELHEHLGTNL